MMDSQSVDLLKQIEEIQGVVADCESQLNDLLGQFDWTKEELLKPVRTRPKSAREENDEEKKEKTKCVDERPRDTAAAVNESVDLDVLASLCATIDKKTSLSNSYADINKLKRDLKRRRMKYRTTKSAPLTYTEELRELIQLQMELLKSKND